MPKPETLLVGRILKRLREERSGFWFKVHGGPFQRAGLPDIIGCYKGRFVGLEVKRPGEEATPLQLHTLREITRAGGLAGVITSYEEAVVILDG